MRRFLEDREDRTWLYRSESENHQDRQARISEVMERVKRLNLTNEKKGSGSS